MSERFVNSTRSAALLPLPMLLPAQMKRYQSRPFSATRFR
jgi:hypothetical protein